MCPANVRLHIIIIIIIIEQYIPIPSDGARVNKEFYKIEKRSELFFFIVISKQKQRESFSHEVNIFQNRSFDKRLQKALRHTL